MYYIASDHRGFRLKEKVGRFLTEKEILVRDLGASDYKSDDDYVDFGLKLGKKIVREAVKGILICRTGVGMTITANKVSGVRACVCFCPKQAQLAVEDNNMNVLCLSAGFVDEKDNIEIVRSFVNAIFVAEERHIRRINKIKKYESSM